MSETPADFAELLDTDASEAVRPPPLPSGTYRATVSGNEGTKSQNKGTPGIIFTFSDLEPMQDVEHDRWQEYLKHPAIKPEMISLSETFWLTKKSLYRLREFCEACGAKPDGKMAKMVGDAMHQRVLITVGQTVSRDSGAVYNEITGYAVDNE